MKQRLSTALLAASLVVLHALLMWYGLSQSMPMPPRAAEPEYRCGHINQVEWRPKGGQWTPLPGLPCLPDAPLIQPGRSA